MAERTQEDPDETAPIVGKATGVKRTLHVEWDPKTGTFVGLPTVWAQTLPKGLSRDETTVEPKSLPQHLAPAAPKKNAPPISEDEPSFISKPFNFKHMFVHIVFVFRMTVCFIVDVHFTIQVSRQDGPAQFYRIQRSASRMAGTVENFTDYKG